ncbi:hypothetical protein TW86_03660 [Halomonas sp. S2151]|uniref:hypothetical protein n=1 Tax=Halomonas sp. S2151 TaxID=579478 RepID=UPI0005F9C6E1|nr:hypothetical protein [Halomonas sp. S2151]KJZ17365.1 hypothetical protein TW86_03660 [Halomonas sp. S2151]
MQPYFTPREDLSRPRFDWRRLICATFIKPHEEAPNFARRMTQLMTDDTMIHRVTSHDMGNWHDEEAPVVLKTKTMMVSDLADVEEFSFNVRPDWQPELALLIRDRDGELIGVPETEYVRYFGGRLPGARASTFGTMITDMTRSRMDALNLREFNLGLMPLSSQIGSYIMDRFEAGSLNAGTTTNILMELAEKRRAPYLYEGQLIVPRSSPSKPTIEIPELASSEGQSPEERYRVERERNPEFGVLAF